MTKSAFLIKAMVDQAEGRRIVAADQVGPGQALDLQHFGAGQP
jgi:hypothetical protein